MTITLAAMLGQIGLRGGGFGFGFGNSAGIGNPRLPFAAPALPTGPNPAASWIPVARMADLLLNPGGHYDFNGERRRYPDIRLVYWPGGNPFHHHQDLNHLIAAWRRPETIVIPRAVVDRVRAARRHRPARHHHPGAQRHRGGVPRPVADGDGAGRGPDATAHATTTTSSPTWPPRWVSAPKFTLGRDEMSWIRALYEEVQRPGRCRGPGPAGVRRILGRRAAPRSPMTASWCCSPTSAPTRTPIRCARRPAASRSSARPWPASATTTAPGYPCWLPPREWLGSRAGRTLPLAPAVQPAALASAWTAGHGPGQPGHARSMAGSRAG